MPAWTSTATTGFHLPPGPPGPTNGRASHLRLYVHRPKSRSFRRGSGVLSRGGAQQGRRAFRGFWVSVFLAKLDEHFFASTLPLAMCSCRHMHILLLIQPLKLGDKPKYAPLAPVRVRPLLPRIFVGVQTEFCRTFNTAAHMDFNITIFPHFRTQPDFLKAQTSICLRTAHIFPIVAFKGAYHWTLFLMFSGPETNLWCILPKGC